MTGESLSSKLELALLDVMEEHFGEQPVEMWTLPTLGELHEVQGWLWGHHADVVLEWTRRKMTEEGRSG